MMLTFFSSCSRSLSTATISHRQANMTDIFARPLITGASVSANWATASPGRRLALRYTEAENIKTIAEGGRPGRLTIRQLRREDFAASSVVVAIDLFFWDSVDTRHRQESLRALKTMIAWSADTGVALVLGDIPELLPGRQQGRLQLNREIHRLCKKTTGCLLWEVDKLHQQVQRDGFLTIAGRKYTLKQLVPDGLHLNEVASEFLADEIQRLWITN